MLEPRLYATRVWWQIKLAFRAPFCMVRIRNVKNSPPHGDFHEHPFRKIHCKNNFELLKYPGKKNENIHQKLIWLVCASSERPPYFNHILIFIYFYFYLCLFFIPFHSIIFILYLDFFLLIFMCFVHAEHFSKIYRRYSFFIFRKIKITTKVKCLRTKKINCMQGTVDESSWDEFETNVTKSHAPCRVQ